jgi:hypothetical protein
MSHEDRSDAPKLLDVFDDDDDIDAPGLCVPMFVAGRGAEPGA